MPVITITAHTAPSFKNTAFKDVAFTATAPHHGIDPSRCLYAAGGLLTA